MKTLYSWKRDSVEGPHDAEAMERSALKRGKNFLRWEWTCEPRECSVKSNAEELGAELNVRRVPVRVSWS